MATRSSARKSPRSQRRHDGAGTKSASKDLAGRPYVLYFYPKDDTPGCTLEGQDFRDRHAEFSKLKVRVLGVSRDTPRVARASFRKKVRRCRSS